jgi:hypothetical protein
MHSETAAFNVSHGAADFSNHHVAALPAQTIDAVLDFIGDMGDDLNRASE